MRNCLILGSGRSGTSMVAGALAAAGYYGGGPLLQPTASNPKGFFESAVINRLNEDILAPIAVAPRRRFTHLFKRRSRGRRLWLALVPPSAALPPLSRELESRIAEQVAQSPFCFKDPRFCYTLPAWRPFLENPAFICVFREPGRTANSIVEECRVSPNYRDLSIGFDWAMRVWTLMYTHVLEKHRHGGDWLFVHYDQVLDGSALTRLESLLEAPVDRGFPEASLKRSPDATRVPAKVQGIYEELCRLSGYRSHRFVKRPGEESQHP